jgi:hypothetical protein
MPITLRRHFNSGQAPAGGEKETVKRLAKILACGAVIVAGGYFALLYWLTSR